MCSAYAKVLRGCTGTSPNPSANMSPLISFTMRNPQATGNLGAMCAAALTFGLAAFQVVLLGSGIEAQLCSCFPLLCATVALACACAGRDEACRSISATFMYMVKTQAPEHDIAAKRASASSQTVVWRCLVASCELVATTELHGLTSCSPGQTSW